MRRSVPFVICFCLCLLASGMTLMALAQDVTRPPNSGLERETVTAAANVDLVRGFYAAVAAVLDTGDGALLDDTIAPDLIEHPARPGAASGRDGFVRALLALRATFPGVSLVVEDVRAAGTDQVVARVHVEGAGNGIFLGRSVPDSFAQWGALDIWRITNGQLVERWSDPDPISFMPLGRASLPVDALGPGHRRVTVTRMTVEPGATLPVDNGQAIRVFAVDAGTLTVTVMERSGGAVSMLRGSSEPVIVETGASFAATPGDRVVVSPEARYTLANDGAKPLIAIAVIVSNRLEGGYPLNSASAAASWTVAAMPEALGGALPSPAGVSAQVLAASVGIEKRALSELELGWVFLTPGAMFVLPAGGSSVMTAVVEGWVDLTSVSDGSVARLESGEWTVNPVGVETLWHAGDIGLTAVLMLTVA